MNSEAAGTEWIRKADALVAKWREREKIKLPGDWEIGYVKATKSCADELAEAIARPAPDESEPAPGSFKCPCCACPWRQCVHDDCSECGGKRLNAEARPVPQPATEPTIEESLRLIRKMEMCEGNAAKLVLLKNFVIRAALALRDVSQGTKR